MPNMQIRHSAFIALMALILVVGYGTAPVAAVSGTNTTLDEHNGEENEFPEEYCTDITGMVHEQAPYDQVIWVDDLPEGAQEYLQPSTIPGTDELPEEYQPPDNIPYNLLTPRAIAGIAIGYTPNQCDVLDPNDPPFDPREDDIDPDSGSTIDEETENGTTLVIVNGTLNQTGEGPGMESLVEFDPETNGEFRSEVLLNDGEKNFGTKPSMQYWDDGTIYLENDVIVIGDRYGAELDCIGEDCTLGLRGTPNLINILGVPSLPSHTDEDPRTDENDSSNEDNTTDDDRVEDEESSGNSDEDSLNDADADAGDSEANNSESSQNGDGAVDESENDGGPDQSETQDDDEPAEDSEGTDEDNDGSDVSEEETENGVDTQEAQVQGDGPGFGVGIAVLSILMLFVIARRRY